MPWVRHYCFTASTRSVGAGSRREHIRSAPEGAHHSRCRRSPLGTTAAAVVVCAAAAALIAVAAAAAIAAGAVAAAAAD